MIARVVRSQLHSYTDRRRGGLAYRLEVVVATEKDQLSVTYFDKKKHIAEWRAAQHRPRGDRAVLRQGRHLPRAAPAHEPAEPDVRRHRGGRERGRGRRGPALGQHPAADHDLPRERGGAELADLGRDRAGPRPGRGGPRAAARRRPGGPRLRLRPAGAALAAPARDLGAEGGGRPAAALRRGVRDPDRARPAAGRAGRRRPPSRAPAGPAGCSTGSTSGCRSRSPTASRR